MTAADHRALMAAVRGESFKDSRVDVLRAGMDGMCLTSSQAKSLIQLFKFMDSKKKALKWMVPRIVGRNKSFQIYSVLQFSSTKSHLKKLLRDTPQHESCAP
ncbi:MAG: DUF4476 domain-containing protein [Deltaproteobacteria bacterium]|nr:DUF4476 domain-containing protein [Deltaproteobacteria bacterium]